MKTRRSLLGVAMVGLMMACRFAAAQGGDESRVHSDFRREGEALKPCGHFSFGNVIDCGQTLVTGQPLHISAGSLAPQNGFALGLAFVEHKDFKDEWRMGFNADAVATGNGSWRAGAYVKAFRLAGNRIVVVQGPGKKTKEPFFQVAPLFNVYAETTSLNKIYFYGLGPNTVPAAQTAFGMTETIAGANGVIPLRHWGTSLFAEVNGRVPRLRAAAGTGVPSIEQVYNEVTAPGISTQPGFLQTTAAVRIQPALFSEHLRLHYAMQLQNYIGVGNSHYTFRRWTADLGHEFPMDKRVRLVAADDRNGPDSCTQNADGMCPSARHVSSAINHEGSVGVRLLMVGSLANAAGVVPFYFDPTVGGSDLNGQAILASFPDYRFRGPNVVMLRETIEHSVPKLPLGVYFSADEAKVGLRRDDINFQNLRTSYSAGLTVHAGGLPVVYLLFAWGGGEGHHTIFNVSNVLLGGSSRPSLF